MTESQTQRLITTMCTHDKNLPDMQKTKTKTKTKQKQKQNPLCFSVAADGDFWTDIRKRVHSKACLFSAAREVPREFIIWGRGGLPKEMPKTEGKEKES